MSNLFAPSHILLIVIFALLFFGPKKLPELGRSVGETIRAFREGTKEAMQNDEKPTPKAPEVVSVNAEHRETKNPQSN